MRSVNHPTVGRIPEGAIIERDCPRRPQPYAYRLSPVLRNPDFTAAQDTADAINREFGHSIANAVDSRTIQIDVAGSRSQTSVPILIARVQALSHLKFHAPAKVVINERTGTIVMGGNPSHSFAGVSVLHGSLSIEVETTYYRLPANFPSASTGTTAAHCQHGRRSQRPSRTVHSA